jgi:hypothetical protein
VQSYVWDSQHLIPNCIEPALQVGLVLESKILPDTSRSRTWSCQRDNFQFFLSQTHAKKRNLAIRKPRILQPLVTKCRPKSRMNQPNWPLLCHNFFWCHSICRYLPKCRIHQMCHGHGAILNRSKSYSIQASKDFQDPEARFTGGPPSHAISNCPLTIVP